MAWQSRESQERKDKPMSRVEALNELARLVNTQKFSSKSEKAIRTIVEMLAGTELELSAYQTSWNRLTEEIRRNHDTKYFPKLKETKAGPREKEI